MQNKNIFQWEKTLRRPLYRALKNFLDANEGRTFLIPGVVRAAKVLFKALQPSGKILAELAGFRLYVNGADRVMTPAILASGVHEPEETRLLQSVPKPGMTVLDLGANIGYFTVLAAKTVGAAGKIIAFEPDPVNRGYLIENLELNQVRNVQIVPKIVSNHSGTAWLYKDKENLGAHTCGEKNIATLQESELEVSCVTLDEFTEESGLRIDFIKMDVQGAEGLVFEKAQKTLEKNPLKILFEFWPAGLRNLGTDPAALLETLSSTFTLREITGELLSPGEALAKAEKNQYLNLYLEKRKNRAEAAARP